MTSIPTLNINCDHEITCPETYLVFQNSGVKKKQSLLSLLLNSISSEYPEVEWRVWYRSAHVVVCCPLSW